MLEGVRERLRQTQTVDGYARSSLYKWVKTDTVPSLAALLRFADRQNVSVVWLLTGHGSPKILDVIDIKNFRNRLSSLVYGEEENIHAQTGIEIATLSSWTHPNQRTFPKIDGLLAIAKTTNASVRWLLTGQGPERPFEGERRHKTQARESPFSEIRSQQMEMEAVRAEDVRLRRLIDTLKTAADGAPARVLGWLDPVFERMEREFVEELSRTFPEWAEKKWGTPHSDNGVA